MNKYNPAFPQHDFPQQSGLTKREFIAALIMQQFMSVQYQFVASKGWPLIKPEQQANYAVICADTLLEALDTNIDPNTNANQETPD